MSLGFIKTIDHSFHAGCWENTRNACKSDGDYNVKRLTRRFTRIKSEDARNIIRNVGRIGDFKTREIFRGLVKTRKGYKELATRNKNGEREMKYGNKLAFAEAVTLLPILIFALFPFFRLRYILFEFVFFFNLRDANTCKARWQYSWKSFELNPGAVSCDGMFM